MQNSLPSLCSLPAHWSVPRLPASHPRQGGREGDEEIIERVGDDNSIADGQIETHEELSVTQAWGKTKTKKMCKRKPCNKRMNVVRSSMQFEVTCICIHIHTK